jgi:hypothetical protein
MQRPRSNVAAGAAGDSADRDSAATPSTLSNPFGPYLSTQQVARALGVHYWRIVSALRADKLPPPLKDTSRGAFWWSPADVEALKTALARDLRRERRQRRLQAEGAAL